MTDFNLELTLGQLMSKVDNSEKMLTEIKEHLAEKASKSEVIELKQRVFAVESSIKPLLDKELISKNDKQRFAFFVRSAPTLLWITGLVAILVSVLFSYHSWHDLKLLHKFMQL